MALSLAVAVALLICGTSAAARVLTHTHVVAHVATARATVKVADSLIGPLLVNHSGRTVYMFTRDTPRRDKCRRIKGCEKDWPAVTTRGKPVVGPGVERSLLGTIPYKGKLREVTYAGYPLHTYRFDTGKESVINIGIRQFGGSWYGLNATGGLIK